MFSELSRLKNLSNQEPHLNFLKEYTAVKLIDRLFFHKKLPEIVNNLSLNDCFIPKLLKEKCIDFSSYSYLIEPEYIYINLNKSDACLSNLSLHQSNDIPGVLSIINKSLNNNGILIGSIYGYGSISSIKNIFYEAEESSTKSVVNRFTPLIKAKDMLNLITRAGFSHSIVDVEEIPISYFSLNSAINDLRVLGEKNILNKKYILSRKTINEFENIFNSSKLHGAHETSVFIIYFYGVKVNNSQKLGPA